MTTNVFWLGTYCWKTVSQHFSLIFCASAHEKLFTTNIFLCHNPTYHVLVSSSLIFNPVLWAPLHSSYWFQSNGKELLWISSRVTGKSKNFAHTKSKIIFMSLYVSCGISCAYKNKFGAKTFFHIIFTSHYIGLVYQLASHVGSLIFFQQ